MFVKYYLLGKIKEFSDLWTSKCSCLQLRDSQNPAEEAVGTKKKQEVTFLP